MRTRKAKRKVQFPLCPNYPQCQCTVQGFVNPREQNDCGKKPDRPPKRVIIRREVGWR